MKCTSMGLLVLPLLLAGCGGGSGSGSSAGDFDSTVLDPDLEGVWSSQSCNSTTIENDWLTNGSELETITVEGNKFTLVTTTYWGPDCSGGVYDKETAISKISLSDPTTSVDGESVTPIKLKVTEYYYQTYNAEELSEYSAEYVKGCGFVPSVGEIVYESQCDVPADERITGNTQYGIYQVDSGVLHQNWNGSDYPDYLGKGNIFADRFYKIQ